MIEKYQQAADILARIGYHDAVDSFQKMAAELSQKTYRIAVIGEFKTGKSTLINRIFLKEEILFTDVMEATAVPTEITYSGQKRLIVTPYMIQTDDQALHPASEPEMPFTAPRGTGEPVILSNPLPDDVRLHTSAETPDARTKLAESTAQVRLEWPAPNLEGLIVIDTPGINSLNTAVIAAAYRVIPSSDLVLFVTSAKQLSQTELEFLSSRVFHQGITRAVAVVTYDAGAAPLSETDQTRLATTIEQQLKQIGRENIPVKLVNLRDIIPGKEGKQEAASFFQGILGESPKPAEDGRQTVNNIIGDLIGESPKAEMPDTAAPAFQSGPSHHRNSMVALEQFLIEYIRRNIRPARQEKAAKVLESQLRMVLARCETELQLMDKTETERQQMLSDIRAQEAELKLKYEQLGAEFREALSVIRSSYIRDANTGIERIADAYMMRFESCEGLGEIQDLLKKAETGLQRDMEAMFYDCAEKAMQQVREAVTSYGIQGQALLHPWQADISRRLSIDGGILAKVPPFAALTLDILLFVRFGPFGPVADILIRLLAHYIPYLNRALPVFMAAGILKRKIRASFTEQFEQIKAELPAQVEHPFNMLMDDLMTRWQRYVADQLYAVRKGLEDAVEKPGDPERKAALKEARTEMERFLI